MEPTHTLMMGKVRGKAKLTLQNSISVERDACFYFYRVICQIAKLVTFVRATK